MEAQNPPFVVFHRHRDESHELLNSSLHAGSFSYCVSVAVGKNGVNNVRLRRGRMRPVDDVESGNFAENCRSLLESERRRCVGVGV